ARQANKHVVHFIEQKESHLNLNPPRRRGCEVAGLCLLLLVLGLQVFFSVRRTSQTWDGANHIYAGYRSLTDADFGLNPEHTPLVKLVATTPLLWSHLKTPALEGRPFKEEAFLGGKDFLYKNDAEAILSRTRKARNLVAAKQLDEALREAQAAVALSPDSVD